LAHDGTIPGSLIGFRISQACRAGHEVSFGVSLADIEQISSRLHAIRERIAGAAARALRRADEVTLVAVSKGQPVEAIRAAFLAGQRDFGESYAQELVQKAQALADLSGVRFHFIGRLQRNKARQVARVAEVVHAVDREDLVVELSRRSRAEGRTLDVLLEVNLSGEITKGGARPAELGTLLDAARRAGHLNVIGLMTIPPAEDDAERSRGYFAELRALRDQHGGQGMLPHLSMGMSHDFEVAVAEGATMVRVGTAIFGERSR
jgi:hypothetical protein